MLENKTNKIQELCFIYNKRIKLSKIRRSIKNKRNYLLAIKRAWMYHNDFTNTPYGKKVTRVFADDILALNDITCRVLLNNPLPKKYASMKLKDIEFQIVSLNKQLTISIAKIATHTKKYRKKVASLSKDTDFSPRYQYGELKSLTSINKAQTISLNEITDLSIQYELSKSIERMLGD